MLNHLSTIKKLKKNFSLLDSIKIFRSTRKNSEEIRLSKGPSFYLRKNTKDYETFGEIFLDHIYDIELHSVPSKIIDGGANIGLASRFFKMKYPDASIVLIEIDKDNLSMISKNLKSYNDITILNN